MKSIIIAAAMAASVMSGFPKSAHAQGAQPAAVLRPAIARIAHMRGVPRPVCLPSWLPAVRHAPRVTVSRNWFSTGGIPGTYTVTLLYVFGSGNARVLLVRPNISLSATWGRSPGAMSMYPPNGGPHIMRVRLSHGWGYTWMGRGDGHELYWYHNGVLYRMFNGMSWLDDHLNADLIHIASSYVCVSGS